MKNKKIVLILTLSMLLLFIFNVGGCASESNKNDTGDSYAFPINGISTSKDNFEVNIIDIYSNNTAVNKEVKHYYVDSIYSSTAKPVEPGQIYWSKLSDDHNSFVNADKGNSYLLRKWSTIEKRILILTNKYRNRQ